jgi:hypothetical protein
MKRGIQSPGEYHSKTLRITLEMISISITKITISDENDEKLSRNDQTPGMIIMEKREVEMMKTSHVKILTSRRIISAIG